MNFIVCIIYPILFISVIKIRMRWARHIACMGQMGNITLSGRHHLKELGRDGRTT
jgi:hypothetical protein